MVFLDCLRFVFVFFLLFLFLRLHLVCLLSHILLHSDRDLRGYSLVFTRTFAQLPCHPQCRRLDRGPHDQRRLAGLEPRRDQCLLCRVFGWFGPQHDRWWQCQSGEGLAHTAAYDRRGASQQVGSSCCQRFDEERPRTGVLSQPGWFVGGSRVGTTRCHGVGAIS